MRITDVAPLWLGAIVAVLSLEAASGEKVHRFALDEFILPWGEEAGKAGRGGGRQPGAVATTIVEVAHGASLPFVGKKFRGVECTQEMVLAGAVGVGCVATLGIGNLINLVGTIFGVSPSQRKRRLLEDMERLQMRLDGFAMERERTAEALIAAQDEGERLVAEQRERAMMLQRELQDARTRLSDEVKRATTARETVGKLEAKLQEIEKAHASEVSMIKMRLARDVEAAQRRASETSDGRVKQLEAQIIALQEERKKIVEDSKRSRTRMQSALEADAAQKRRALEATKEHVKELEAKVAGMVEDRKRVAEDVRRMRKAMEERMAAELAKLREEFE